MFGVSWYFGRAPLGVLGIYLLVPGVLSAASATHPPSSVKVNATSSPSAVKANPADAAALARLYHAFGGVAWQIDETENWAGETDVDPCYWKGVECREVDGFEGMSVVELDMTFFNMENVVMQEGGTNLGGLEIFCELKVRAVANFAFTASLSRHRANPTPSPSLPPPQELSLLNLAHNELRGGLPPCFGELAKLSTLDLSWNLLSEELPDSISNLTQLVRLDLSINTFRGRLPSLETMTNLKFLDLSWNGHDNKWVSTGFEEFLPERWPPSITFVNLAGNSFQGPIPAELCNSPNLVHFEVTNNILKGDLTECLPDVNNKLKKLLLRNNLLYGVVPSWSLFGLKVLDLSDNMLEGPFPAFITQSSMIESINIGSNSFEGPLPAKFSSAVVNEFIVSDNDFNGTIPNSYLDWTNLVIFDCSSNELVGEFNHDWTALPTLQVLSMGGNEFTGSLPSFYSESLLYADFEWCSFTGTVPSNISGENLRTIRFSNNNLTGPLPSSLLDLPYLAAISDWETLDDIACPAGYSGDDYGEPFKEGCRECKDDICQPFLAQTFCPDGCAYEDRDPGEFDIKNESVGQGGISPLVWLGAASGAVALFIGTAFLVKMKRKGNNVEVKADASADFRGLELQDIGSDDEGDWA